MEQDILRREEEMFSAASSTRCMSCGQLPADPTNAFINHTAARRAVNVSHHVPSNPAQQHAESQSLHNNFQGAQGGVLRGGVHTGLLKTGHRPNSSPSAPSSQQEYSPFHPTGASSAALIFNPSADGAVPDSSAPLSRARSDRMDDEISLHSEHSFNNQASLQSTSQVLGPLRSEEIYSVITGSAGLKSLMPQHAPMQPVRQPYSNTTASTIPHKTAKRADRIPEPMYRKAKMAAHLKEMVKVSAPSAQNYGFTPNNPFFVMDGYVDEANPHINLQLDSGTSSLHSKASASTRRPRTQGSQAHPQQQVYVPIPRGSANPNSPTHQLLLSASTNAVGDMAENISVGTILPHIVNK